MEKPDIGNSPPRYEDTYTPPTLPPLPAGGAGYELPSVITQQPAAALPPAGVVNNTYVIAPAIPSFRSWTSGTCSCFLDMTSCVCGMCCTPCYLCHISKDMGEGCCMPCCIPPTSALAMLRVKLRTQEKIYGSVSSDYCSSCCCHCCTLCQLKRELDFIRIRQDTERQFRI